jgi:Transposase domain (DUF772)
MISSLPGIVFTAAEHAAQPVATRITMPIDCSNPDCNIGRRIKRMSCSRRLMAGLVILKHTYDLSDEMLCERWVENHHLPVLLRRGVLPTSAGVRSARR